MSEVTSPHVSPDLARGLAARLRDALQAADRLASFSFNGESGDAPAPQLVDGEELATSHDFVLRVFRGACERGNAQILGTVVNAGDQGAGVDRLAADLGLTRMATLERVNDLIQLGLVARDLPQDVVRATPAGEGLLELLSELEIEVAEWLRHRKRP